MQFILLPVLMNFIYTCTYRLTSIRKILMKKGEIERGSRISLMKNMLQL